MLAWLFHILVLPFSVASVPDLPLAQVEENSAAYISVEQAAFAALNAVSSPFEPSEYGGIIVEKAGKFYFTRAVTLASDSKVAFRVLLTEGQQLAGIYHTHPEANLGQTHLRDLSSHEFSRTDIQMARKLNVPSYIAVEDDRSIRRYDPSDTLLASEKGENLGRLRSRSGLFSSPSTDPTLSMNDRRFR